MKLGQIKPDMIISYSTLDTLIIDISGQKVTVSDSIPTNPSLHNFVVTDQRYIYNLEEALISVLQIIMII